MHPPTGTTFHRVQFVALPGSEGSSGRPPLHLLDASDGRCAHEEEGGSLANWDQLSRYTVAGQDLLVVSSAAPIDGQAELAQSLLDALRTHPDFDAALTTLISLQGAHLVLAPGFLGVIAVEGRLAAAKRSAVEVVFHEAELRAIEDSLTLGWGAALDAAPVAFEGRVEAPEAHQAREKRYLEIVALRGRYSRLGPKVMIPQVYPPTVASQVGERVRERMKMWDRYDLLDGHLTSQEEIYMRGAERVSEFRHARRGHTLEWIIIVILAVHTLLWLVEVLAGAA